MLDLYGTQYRETAGWTKAVSRYGLSKMPPLIITCAITGGAQGAEVNPALPETPQDQAQSAYDAYNAGASMIHIHARNPKNLGYGTNDVEDFIKVNQLVREKCPDVIVNNTCIGTRNIDMKNKVVGEQALVSINAKPEVSSIDIFSGEVRGLLKARKAPLSGRDEDLKLAMTTVMTMEDCLNITGLMNDNGIKPEWECYDISALKMLSEIIAKEKTFAPHWIQFLFGGNGAQPSVEYMQLVTKLLPENSLLSVIGIGACQTAILTYAILMGHHVRVGMEDSFFYGPGELAASNAQLVERIVRIAKELGREVATPAQAREILGLGAPRQY